MNGIALSNFSIKKAVNMAKMFCNLYGDGLLPYSVNVRPVTIGIFVTRRCNLGCSYCNYNIEVNNDKEYDMTVEDFSRIINLKYFSQAVNLSVSGGEPLMNDNLYDIISHARSRNLRVSMASNGTLIKRNLKNLIDADIDRISISLYDNFEEAQRENISAYIRERRASKNEVSLTKIMTRENFFNIEKYIKLALDVGADEVKFQNFYLNDREETLKKAVPREEHFMNEISRLKRKYKRERVSIRFHSLLDEIRIYKKRCIPLETMATFDRFGNMALCCYIAPPDRRFGNILEDDTSYHGYKRKVKEGIASGDVGGVYKDCKYCHFIR